MKKLPVLILAAIVFAACNSSSTTSSSSDTTVATDTTSSTGSTEANWTPLFDGSTLNGWHSFGSDSVTGGWKVDSGAVHLDASAKKGRGDLVSNDTYDNFDLKLDWKISKAGNSGVLFYVQDDKAKYEDTYKTGPEMQVLDDERHEDNKLPTHRAGSLYDMIQATPGAVKPAEEWNSAEIVSNNGKLDFYLNGQHVVNS